MQGTRLKSRVRLESKVLESKVFESKVLGSKVSGSKVMWSKIKEHVLRNLSFRDGG